MKLGEMVDALYQARQRVHAAKREYDAAQAAYKELELNVLQHLKAAGLQSSKASSATAIITKTDIAVVNDWDVFIDHVIQNDARHLLARRIAQRAVLEEGDVPGVSKLTVERLGLRRN